MSGNQAGTHLADAVEHLDEMYGYAMLLARDPAEAEDLVQVTYAHACEANSRAQAGTDTKGWLFTILRNAWLNQLRKRRQARQMFGYEGDKDTFKSIAETSKNSYRQCMSSDTAQLRIAIENLPAESREIIFLREYQDLSYQEIAAILNCPVGTVISRLGNARTNLRTLLATMLNTSNSMS